jgi:hypothetical protein
MPTGLFDSDARSAADPFGPGRDRRSDEADDLRDRGRRERVIRVDLPARDVPGLGGHETRREQGRISLGGDHRNENARRRGPQHVDRIARRVFHVGVLGQEEDIELLAAHRALESLDP